MANFPQNTYTIGSFLTGVEDISLVGGLDYSQGIRLPIPIADNLMLTANPISDPSIVNLESKLIPIFSLRSTFSTSFVFTPQNSATDILEIRGVDGRILSIKKIEISGYGYNRMMDFYFIKRSSLDTGSSISYTPVAHSTQQALNPAVVGPNIKRFTSNPTLGNTIGNVGILSVFLPAANTAECKTYTLEYDQPGCDPIILTSSTETLCINLNGLTSNSILTFNITFNLL